MFQGRRGKLVRSSAIFFTSRRFRQRVWRLDSTRRLTVW